MNEGIVLTLIGLGLAGVLTDRHGSKRQVGTVLPADEPEVPTKAA